MIRTGDILQGRYRIKEAIGSGGIGMIFRAEDLNLEKDVVVKKIKENFVEKLETRSEVDILKSLHHRYLPQVYDFFQNGSEVYTVMDYIEGRDLEHYLQEQIMITEQEIFRWLWQLLEVLDYLHGRTPPIYHCDIKPANIMIRPEGDVCLIDFNISLGDNEKTLKGLSRWYSAPEQREAAVHPGTAPPVDERMDLYSLGATFYALMTGYYPDPEKESVWTEESRQKYNSGLIEIISKSMEQDRRYRFKNAREMQQALENVAKWETSARRAWWLRVGTYALSAVFLTCGVSMLLYGSYRTHVESWQGQLKEFRQISQEKDEEEIIREGIRLLDSTAADKYMTQEERGEILWQIGEAYYQEEDYDEASRYYRRAYQSIPDEVQLHMDYAFSLIRGGRLTAAEEFIGSIQDDGMQDEQMRLLEGEMMVINGKYEEATAAAEEVISHSRDDNIRLQACILAADAAAGKGDPEEELMWLQKADKWKTDRSTMRRIVQIASGMYRTSGEKEEYLQIALKYAKEICDLWELSQVDRLNLAVVRLTAGQTEEAIDTLQAMEEEDTGMYQVPMYLAIHSYNEEIKKSRDQRNFNDFFVYCEEASELYRSAGESDEQMESLQKTYEDLRERSGT